MGTGGHLFDAPYISPVNYTRIERKDYCERTWVDLCVNFGDEDVNPDDYNAIIIDMKEGKIIFE